MPRAQLYSCPRSRPRSPLQMAQILVVEDSADLRALFVVALQQAGHQVSEAADGAGALERIPEVHPDLIVLDLMLPIVSGLQVLSEVKANSKTSAIPIVVTTGTLTFERDIKHLGAAALLRKPVTAPQLVDTVRAILAQCQFRQKAI